MNIDLPKQTVVDKFIPKSKFFSKAKTDSKTKQEFADKIQKITWSHKLSEKTINLPKTPAVEEIQIFEILLKTREIPKKIIKIIQCSIPYPILFVLRHKEDISYAISLKSGAIDTIYNINWGESKQIEFTGTSLELLYQNLIKQFVTSVNTTDKQFNQVIDLDQQIQNLSQSIVRLESKIKKEVQFNKKVELNSQLNKLKKQIKELKNQ